MAELLWVPSFQPGSYFPSVPVVRALRDAGHRVTALCERAAEASFHPFVDRFTVTEHRDAFVASARPGRDGATKLARHAGAACAGIPMLLIPDGRDRFVVARGAEGAGIAVVIPREALTAENCREAIRRLLHEPGFRIRAREVAAAAAGYDAANAAVERIGETIAASPTS